MTHLFLVRHAEAHSNQKAVAAGPKGDSGLTALGRTQAEKLRERLRRTREIQPDVIISSDLPRAKETAEIVASLWNLPLILDQELREVNAGVADGLSLDEIRQKYNLEGFLKDYFQVLAPEAESRAQFAIRATLALKRIITLYHGKTILIFTHGSVIDRSFDFFFNISPLVVSPINFSNNNTAITYWEWGQHAQELPPRWRLNRCNDDAHLRSL